MLFFTSQISIHLLLLLFVTTFHVSISSNQRVVRCNEKDKERLLIFKKGVIDDFNFLSTWSNEDCCTWKGVECNNTTDRVTKLDLNNGIIIDGERKPLKGEINLSLLELEFLNYLDLSWNHFDVINIPPIHDNVTLSSNLHYLDLSGNLHPQVDNLYWLYRLSSLKYLYLSRINLQKESNWLQLVAMLPSLSELHMHACNLYNINSSLNFVNFTSLTRLDLSYNKFSSELPNWLFNLSAISYLDLSRNSIHGEIPASFLNLRNLRYLHLSFNQLKGKIPNWFGQQNHLQHLDLSHNLFCGHFPSSLGNLSSIVSLHIGSNSFFGAVSKLFFSKLSNLKELDLSSSTFAFHLDPEWIPPFQLNWLNLANTNQGPYFPSWIYTQKSLQILEIYSTGISMIDEDRFWSFVAKINSIYLSNNSMSGDISNVTLNCTIIWLNRNNFTGGLPHISPKATAVDFSHNSFSGPFPRGWQNRKDLVYIDLWSNKFSGKVPMDLSNMKHLRVLNLGKNDFSGTLPIKMPQKLQVMILRFNRFEENIPPQLFNLSFLFHLDLAHNKISGSIPKCVYNMTQMIASAVYVYTAATYDWFTKGQDYECNVDPSRRTIDLSTNKLYGEIPLELFQLTQVHTLNLSYNHLTGTIQKTVGNMTNLESLDLSNNEFYGEIPQSMAGLTFLSYLNLSCNNFTGQIPIGTQLQSFNASSYAANPELCGAPLIKCFTEEENPEKAKHDARNENDEPEKDSLLLGMEVGFFMGFLGVIGCLIFVRKWRHSYYRFLNRVADQLYVFMHLRFGSFC